MNKADFKMKVDHLPMRSEEKKDLRRLYVLLQGLSDEGIIAIYFRFWERLLIEDIARILGRSWTETDRLIENSIGYLRDGFLKNHLSAQFKAA